MVYTTLSKYAQLGPGAGFDLQDKKDAVFAYDANFNWDIYKEILEIDNDSVSGFTSSSSTNNIFSTIADA